MKNKFLFTALVFALVATLSLTGCAKSLTPEEQVQQTLDAQTLQKAMTYQNAELCTAIKDSTVKQVCETTVKEQKLEKEIVETKDVSRCAELSVDSLKQLCWMEVKAKIAAAKSKEQMHQEVIDKNDLLKQIVEAKDVSKCTQLEDLYWINVCKQDISAASSK
ncbi:MAG: hypothetical protein UT33_C0008G0010 [Candidatus Peregrinibacteria bacterium GW2011_GWC2_39_14]|nr:MAG: hypothetical protein US92_C0004G0010 [Candidatus Peregrinibacteria bacterium GW2011_GWA2_38_36]KKR06694.1 MAG: hypothetical protein UT33_C0008G0010 [Candidatus Peregrinibacteria bacterium GW2011_GWC2_39_14]